MTTDVIVGLLSLAAGLYLGYRLACWKMNVPPFPPDCPTCDGYGQIDCPDCSGTGEKEDQP